MSNINTKCEIIENDICICLWCRYSKIIDNILICQKQNKQVKKDDNCSDWRYKF